MSSEPPTLRERKKRATRERLLEVAQELFVERGYEATTMDEIAARADVARATVFNYFPRKDEFLFAWIAARRQAIAALLATEQDDAVDTGTRLEHALMGLCEMLESDPRANRALIRAFVTAGGQLLPGASDTAEVFAETLRHGQASGDIRPDLDPELAGRAILDAYSGAIIRWAADESPLRESLRAVLDVLVDGLRPAPRRADEG